ncbi:MAG: protein kinase [Candidatus Levybacteria bacterium]|nr:protein kinase [Candidatus Levybacteria bacterium]
MAENAEAFPSAPTKAPSAVGSKESGFSPAPTAKAGEKAVPANGKPKDVPIAPTDTDKGAPQPEPLKVEADENGVYTANVVNRQGDLEKRIRKEAQDQVREHQQKGKAWDIRTWPRKMRFRFGEDYYVQRGIKMLRDEAVKNNNVFLDMDIIKKSMRDAGRNKAEHTSEAHDKLRQISLGQQIEGDTKFQDVKEAQGPLKDLMVKEIFKPIVDGTITDEAGIQNKLREFVAAHENHADQSVKDQLNAMFGQGATEFAERAKIFASDFLEVGQAIKSDVEANKFAVDKIGDKVRINLANTEWAASTQTKFSRADQLATRLKSTKYGGWVNEATVGAFVSVGTFVAWRGAGQSLRAVGFGVGAGAVMGYFERNRNLKKDIATHRADTEYGQNIDTTKRTGGKGRVLDSLDMRKKLETFRYKEMASVNDILNSDEDRNTVGGDSRSLNTLLSLDISGGNFANRDALVRRVAEIQERLKFSADQGAGMIQFAEGKQVERGRLELVKGIVQGKEALVKSIMATGVSEADARGEVGRLVQSSMNDWEKRFTGDTEQQDKAFARYRVASSLRMGAFGGAVGFASAVLVQQGVAEIGAHPFDNKPVNPTLLQKADAAIGTNLMENHSIPNAEAVNGLREALSNNQPNEVMARFGEIGIQTHTELDGRIIIDKVNGATIDTPVPPTLTYNPDTTSFTFAGELPPQVEGVLKQNYFDINTQPSPSEAINANPGVTETVLPGTDTKVSIPNGTELRPGENGTWDLVTKDVTTPQSVMQETKFSTPGAYGIGGESVTIPGEGAPIKIAEGLQFSATGEMTAYNIVRPDIIQLGESVPGPETTTNVEQWLGENTAHVDGYQWYGNDSGKSDNNELRLYDNRVPGTVPGEDAIRFDMLSMENSWQNGNFPPNVDVPDAIRDDKAVFTFWDKGNPNEPIIVKADHGQITLDKNSDQMIQVWKTGPDGTQQWMDVKNSEVANVVVGDMRDFESGSDVGYKDILNYNVSAGDVQERPDGRTIVSSYATATGTGSPPAEIPGGQSEITTFKAVQSTEIKMPDSWEPMPIVIPATPRRHLKDGEKSENEQSITAAALPSEIDKPEDAEDSGYDYDDSEYDYDDSEYDYDDSEEQKLDAIDATQLVDSQVRSLHDDANQLLKDGKPREAITMYEQAIDLAGDKTPWSVYYNRGRANAAVGNSNEAIIDYEEAARLEPLSAKPVFRLGQTHFAAGDLDAAEAAFQSAIDLPLRDGDEDAQRRARAGLVRIARRRQTASGEPRQRESLRFTHPKDIERYDRLREWVRTHPDVHHPYHQQTREIMTPTGPQTEVVKDARGREIWLDEKGQPIERNTTREKAFIKTYLDGQYARNRVYDSRFSDYKEFLQTSTAAMAPMKEECRVSICLPAMGEGRIIYDALSQYVTQTDSAGNEVDPDSWEMNVLVNRKTGTPADSTVAEIQRFVQDINDERARTGKKLFNINFADVEFDPPKYNNVGTARKVATDLTFYRSLQRSKQVGPLYIAPEDADITHADPHLVHTIMTKLDENPQLDIVRGTQDRDPEIIMQNDYLFLRRRLDDFKNIFMTSKDYRSEDTNPNYNFRFNRIVPSGWNTAFSAEAIALSDGYSDRAKLGENRIMAEKITMLRGDGTRPNLEVIGRMGTRAESSPRRFIAEVISGQPAYESFDDTEINALIRKFDDTELLGMISSDARITEENQAKFEELIANHIVRNAKMSPDPVKYADSMMFWLGFKRQAKDGKGQQLPSDYTVDDDGRVHITNWSNVSNALHDYRTRHNRPREQGERWGNRKMPEGQLATFPRRYTLAELQSSTQTETRGNYTVCLDRKIGEGWNGQVVAGYDNRTNTVVAVKTLDKQYVEDVAQQNIRIDSVNDAEDYIKTQITSPDPSLLLYEERFEEGNDVIKIYPAVSVNLAKQIEQGGKMAPQQAVGITQQLLKGVSQLHQAGIGHFDIKPGNILFDEQGRAYLSDFDEVTRWTAREKRFIRPPLTASNLIIPPEGVTANFQGLTANGDTYEMGINLYYMLEGKYPFDPKNARAAEKSKMYREIEQSGITGGKRKRAEYVRRLKESGDISFSTDVPDALQAVIRKSLQYTPADRYQSAAAMANALENLPQFTSPDADTTVEAEQNMEAFINSMPRGFNRYKAEAIEQGKAFLQTPEAQSHGPKQSEQDLQNFWKFYLAYPQDKLREDDSTVGSDLKKEVQRYIPADITDTDEREEITQVIGKFFATNPGYQPSPDQIQVLIQAYNVVDTVM